MNGIQGTTQTIGAHIQNCIQQLDTADFYTLLDMTFGDLLDAQAIRFPDHECVIAMQGAQRYTYAAFKQQSDKLARGLLAIGIKKGDHVAIWSENCAEWVLLMFATSKIGAVLVTVNTNYKRYELEYLLRQSDSMTLVLSSGCRGNDYMGHLLAACPELTGAAPGKLCSQKLPKLKNVITVGDFHAQGAFHWDDILSAAEMVSDEARIQAQAAVKPQDIANMQYTSGTTGFPKGVMLTHHSIINNGKSIGDRKQLTPDDRECIPVPLFHCFGCVLGVTSCVTHASAMVIIERFQPLAVMQMVQQERCTSLLGVPTMFIAILAHEKFSSFDYSSLRTGIMAGSPCPVEVMRKVNSDMHMPEITIAFGQTECSPVATMTAVDDPLEKRVATVGRCQPNIEIKLIDPETGKTVPQGVPGEFLTRGYHVMQGYYNMPDATRSAIDSEGWLHSGDLCVLDEDGYYVVTGRLKDMIIRGGENIYPREIEEFLYTHPAVSDVQVVGVPDEKYGEEALAFVIVKEGKSATEDELKEYMQTGLSRFKTPRYIQFVAEFPLTASGKIQKYKLRELGVELLGLQSLPAAKATLGRGKSEDEATVTQYIVHAHETKGGTDMTEQLMEIGIRLRALREISDISIGEMAKATRITEEEYEKYEQGVKDFSFSFLYTAAQFLGVDVSDLMHGVSPRLSSCAIVRAGHGRGVERRAAYSYMALAHTFRNKRAEPFLVTVHPVHMPDPHSHEGQEFQYVLEGEAQMIVGDDTFTLHPGDAVYFDSSHPHALTALNDQPAKFLAVVIK